MNREEAYKYFIEGYLYDRFNFGGCLPEDKRLELTNKILEEVEASDHHLTPVINFLINIESMKNPEIISLQKKFFGYTYNKKRAYIDAQILYAIKSKIDGLPLDKISEKDCDFYNQTFPLKSYIEEYEQYQLGL